MFRLPGTSTVIATMIVAVMALTCAACSLFETRTPEPPASERGTYLQPDTPDRVVENIRFALAEQNTRNYTRSLADGLTFQPTATAQSRDPIWSGWSTGEEEAYFATLVSAISADSGLSLDLNDASLTAIDPERFVYDATYVITADHNRSETPRIFQGRLSWEIVQQNDGLWALMGWSDREVGSEPSWSDLKAAFSS